MGRVSLQRRSSVQSIQASEHACTYVYMNACPARAHTHTYHETAHKDVAPHWHGANVLAMLRATWHPTLPIICKSAPSCEQSTPQTHPSLPLLQ